MIRSIPLMFLVLVGCPVSPPRPPESSTSGFVPWPRECPGALSCPTSDGCADGLVAGPHQLCTVECRQDADCQPAWAGDTCIGPDSEFAQPHCGVPCRSIDDCEHMRREVPTIACIEVGTPRVAVCGIPWQP